jgi:hypothetical protein
MERGGKCSESGLGMSLVNSRLTWLCPDTGEDCCVCQCHLCVDTRLKVAIWLRKRGQVPEPWLLDVEVPKAKPFYWRAKEYA